MLLGLTIYVTSESFGGLFLTNSRFGPVKILQGRNMPCISHEETLIFS